MGSDTEPVFNQRQVRIVFAQKAGNVPVIFKLNDDPLLSPALRCQCVFPLERCCYFLPTTAFTR